MPPSSSSRSPASPSATASVTSTPRHSAEKLVGQLIQDKYRVDRVIGMGGMGVVVAATQLQLDRPVAIKLVRQDMAADPNTVERLLQEARSAARIRNEHVAHVLDFGTLPGGAPFIVMEYLEGDDLATVLQKEGPLAIPQAIDLLLQACEAVGQAHHCGIVHRDLKPGNLFIARLLGGSPCLKVVDFGISKQVKVGTLQVALTTSPRILGTPNYMAPEQMRGHVSGPRSDIWALGAILFEMLTGKQAFEGDTLPRLCQKVLTGRPTRLRQYRPDAPEKLERIIERCLSKKQNDRFDDIAHLARKLAPFGQRRARLSLEHVLAMAETTNPGRTEEKPPPKSPAAPAVPSPPPQTLRGTPQPASGAQNAPQQSGRLASSAGSTSSDVSDALPPPDSEPSPSAGPDSDEIPNSTGPRSPSTLAGLPHSVNALPPSPPRNGRAVAGLAVLALLLGGAVLSLRRSPAGEPRQNAVPAVTERARLGLQPAPAAPPIAPAESKTLPVDPALERNPAPLGELNSDGLPPVVRAQPVGAETAPQPETQAVRREPALEKQERVPSPEPTTRPALRRSAPKPAPSREGQPGRGSDPWNDQNFGSRL